MVPKSSIQEIFPEKIIYWEDIKMSNNKNSSLEIYELKNLKNDENNTLSNDNQNILNKKEKKQIYRLQLASVKKSAYNYDIKKKIRLNHNDLDNNLGVLIDSEVNIPGLGPYIRIQTKKLFSKDDAMNLCKIVIKKKKQCLVVKVL